MKKLGFEEKAGWPSSTDTWLYMQEMMQEVENVAVIGGNNYILRGCEVNANQVSPGVLVLNGEVLLFDGGLVQQYVLPVQEDETKMWFGGVFRPYYLRRKAAFGSGPGQVEWESLKRNNPANSILLRIEKLEQLAAPFMPVVNNEGRGGMVLWNKPAIDIPAGWQEVIDWRGRMPVGMDLNDALFDEIGKEGGAKNRLLQAVQLPPHSIPVPGQTGGDNSDHTNQSQFAGGDKSPNTNQFTINVQFNNANQQPVDLMNPYRTVLFIEYIG
jgi:hypothetical protein